MVRPGGVLIFDHYIFDWKYMTLAEPYYRLILKRLPAKLRLPATDAITRFFFPIHWFFRDSVWMQRLLRRISPVHFYYPNLPLKDRDAFYQWARLDTHDGTTDWFKHHRSRDQIATYLESLGATDINVRVERKMGNGVEALCRKPAAS
jgi:hypothetical protein